MTSEKHRSPSMPERGNEHAIQIAKDRLAQYLDEPEDTDQVLYDKQMEVMRDLYEFLSTHSGDLHGYISLPTGVGKTVLFTELIKATGLRTLVLTPTQLLIEQTENVFNRFGDEDVVVGKVYQHEKNGEEQITLTTYASFVKHTNNADSALISPGQYDLIILDEAHRALGAQSKKALAKYTDTIKIGFTATEEYSEKRKLQALLPTEIHKISIKEAVEHNLIAPFTNLVVETGVNASHIRILSNNEYNAGDLEKELNVDDRSSIAVELYKKYFQGQKAIAFCNGIAHATAVAAIFNKAGLNAAALHGRLDSDYQAAVAQKFGMEGPGAIDILTNDKLLAEGFDAPNATVCFNLAPTLSSQRAKQRGGRVLRLDPNNPNKHAYIIDFVDDQYLKPPVLFSDPKVAEQAQVGDISHSIFTDSADEPLRETVTLIKNPVLVTQRAHEFASFTRQQIERPVAPHGWLTVGQVCSLYNLDKADAERELFALLEKYPEEKGEFPPPNKNAKTRALKAYFGPDLVKEFVTTLGLDHIDMLQKPPNEWMTLDDLMALYPAKALKSAQYIAQTYYSAAYFDHWIAVDDKEYFSPYLLGILRKRAQKIDTWKPVAGLSKAFHVTENAIEELGAQLAKQTGFQNELKPCWWVVNGKESLFASPLIYGKLIESLKQAAAQSPRPLPEDEVIPIRKAQDEDTPDLLSEVFLRIEDTPQKTPPQQIPQKMGSAAINEPALPDEEDLYAEEFRRLD